MDEKLQINLRLSLGQVNTILQIMAQQRFDIAAPVINAIHAQTNPQVQAAANEAALAQSAPMNNEAA